MPAQYMREFRRQYPQYNAIPDRELAARLIRKDPARWTPLFGDLVAGPPGAFGAIGGPAAGTPDAPEPLRLTTTDVLRGVAQGADFVLPLGGAVLGGALAAPSATVSGPLGPVAGGALGAGIGQAGSNLVSRFIGGLDPEAVEPRTLGQELGETGSAILTGAAGEGTGQLLTGLLRRFLQRGLTSAEIGFMQDAARFGIPTTAAERTGSPGLGVLEGYPIRFPFGAGPQTRLAQARLRKVEGAARDIGAGLGREVDLQTAGTTVKRELEGLAEAQVSAARESVERYIHSIAPPAGRVELGETLTTALRQASEQRRRAASAVYDAVEQQFGAAAKPAARLHVMARQILQREAAVRGAETGAVTRPAGGIATRTAPPPVASGDLSDTQLTELIRAGVSPSGPLAVQDLPAEFVRRYGLDQPRSLTFGNLREYQARLASLIRNTQDDFTKRRLRGLFDAVSAEIDDLGAGEAVRRANAFYKNEVAQFFGRRSFVRDLMDTSEKDRLTDRLMAIDSPTQVRQILRVLPRDTADTYRASFLQRLHDEGLDATGEWSPARFLRGAGRYTDDTLKELLGPRWAEFGRLRASLQRQAGKEGVEPLFGQIARADEPAVVGKFLRKNGAEDVRTVFQNLSTEGKEQARRAAWDSLLRQSVDPQTSTFSSHRFLSRLNEVDTDTWQAFLPEDAFEAMGQLRRVLNRVQATSRLGENPSQTARGVGTMSQVGGAATLGTGAIFGAVGPARFAIGAITLAHPYLLGKFLTSKRGINLLTQGLLVRPGTEQAIRLSADVAAFLGKESAE